MNTLEKPRELPEGPGTKLTKLSKELFFDDRRGRIATNAYKRHLEEMASFADQIESRGYTIWVESIPKKFGYTRIYINSSRHGFEKEILVYDQNYDSSLWNSDGNFIDPYPDKKSLEQIFEKAIQKIESVNKKSVHKIAA